MIDLTSLLQALLTLVAAIITSVLVPYLKEKYGEERLKAVKTWARAAAAAAEEIYKGEGLGKDKLEYVLAFLEERGFGVDRESLRKIVEAELYELGLK